MDNERFFWQLYFAANPRLSLYLWLDACARSFAA